MPAGRPRPTPIQNCSASTQGSTAARSRCAKRTLGLREFTWNEYQSRVKDFALGMIELGLGRGDVIGIIGDTRPDWVAAEIAAHVIGGMSLGLYRDVLDEEAAYLLSYGGVKPVFAEDEEQVDKLLGLADRAPNLTHIVYSDPRGMRKDDDPRLMEAERARRHGPRPRRARARPLRWPRGCDQGGGRRDPLHDLGDHRTIQSSRCSRPGVEAQVVFTPLVLILSFTAIGTPARGESFSSPASILLLHFSRLSHRILFQYRDIATVTRISLFYYF